jgi:glycerol-3-phosphate acyltransferase PlsX
LPKHFTPERLDLNNQNLPTKTKPLPVALDAMGGDYGPTVVVEGAVQAARELGLSSVLVGREDEIREQLNRLDAEDDPHIFVSHAPEVITMEDSPATAIRRKRNSSIGQAFELVREGKASSVLSAGNTGAVMAAGLFVSGALPGIGRPAIASLIPRVGNSDPIVLLDSGANVDCHAHQLVQFALMGNYYARSVLTCDKPRVALLSNGSESSKGNDITRAAAMMLSQLRDIRYVGYVEGRDISRDVADVIVCDGFVGNIVLKTMEGAVDLVLDSIKQYVEASPRGKFGMWLAKPVIKNLFRTKLDPSSYGGAPLLGLNDIAIICHGSASARAIMNAIRVANKFVDEALVARVSQALGALEAGSGTFEDGMWNRMGQKFEKQGKKRADSETDDVVEMSITEKSSSKQRKGGAGGE